MFMLRYLSILSLFFLSGAVAYAQTDTTRSSFRERFLPTGIRIGTDAISISRNYYDKTFSGWEANADLDFNRYFLAVDYGHWGREYNKNAFATYSNDGSYFRVGVDVNFLVHDPDRNMFFVGARYGHSVFEETLYVFDQSQLWGDKEETYRNSNLNAHWYELTTGLRVKLWKFIWMGYTARFKFGLKTGATPNMLPSDVPGYGNTDKESTWGFNYQLFFRLPVRELPPLPPKKKKKK
jgi:hypothetical protein